MTRWTFTGRMVGGSATEQQPQRKDDRTGALKFLKNGEPDRPFYLSLAVPKNPAARFVIPGNPSYEQEKAKIDADAKAAWPQFFSSQRNPNIQYGAHLAADCTNPAFANKVIDGDGFDDKGQPFANNDGWAGCWIIKVQRYYAPNVYEWVENWVDPVRPGAPYTGWKDVSLTGRKIKAGDYITVSGECESNKSSDSPGMYMNHDTISFEAEGEAIILRSAVDPNAALGQRGPNAAASAPAASSAAPAPGAPASETAPAYSGYREATSPAAPAAPAAPPAGPQMTAKADGVPYEEFVKQNWTDDALRAHGYMV